MLSIPSKSPPFHRRLSTGPTCRQRRRTTFIRGNLGKWATGCGRQAIQLAGHISGARSVIHRVPILLYRSVQTPGTIIPGFILHLFRIMEQGSPTISIMNMLCINLHMTSHLKSFLQGTQLVGQSIKPNTIVLFEFGYISYNTL